jgi:hypothetical protein
MLCVRVYATQAPSSSQPIVGGAHMSAGASGRAEALAVVKSVAFLLHLAEWVFSIIVMATASSAYGARTHAQTNTHPRTRTGTPM